MARLPGSKITPSKPFRSLPNESTFNVRVWTDKADAPKKRDRLNARDISVLPEEDDSSYRLGNRIVVYFGCDRDCYVRLININSAGEVRQIFPNVYEKNNLIRAGQIHSLPGPGYGGFEFSLTPPTGLETVRAIASTKPFDIPEGERVGPFRCLSARTIEVRPEDKEPFGLNLKKPLPEAEGWAEAYCRFNVRE